MPLYLLMKPEKLLLHMEDASVKLVVWGVTMVRPFAFSRERLTRYLLPSRRVPLVWKAPQPTSFEELLCEICDMGTVGLLPCGMISQTWSVGMFLLVLCIFGPMAHVL